MMRYKGQSFELQIKRGAGDLMADFHRAHRARYGYAQEENEIEIVSARVRSSGLVEKIPNVQKSREKRRARVSEKVIAYLEGKKCDCCGLREG